MIIDPRGQYRRRLALLAGVALILSVTASLSGCATPTATPVETVVVSPTDTPTTALPTETLEAATPTAVSTVAPQVALIGVQTPVPIIYKMFDWGTDFQSTQPELGPIGSIQFALWEAINPSDGQYRWEVIDEQLAKEANLKVTLPDGTEIQKPVVIQVMAHISSREGWSATYYDATPGWVYNQIDAANPSDPRPVVNGKKVGHALEGCSTTAVLPMYDSVTWRSAYLKMVKAFGERYNDNPQVAAIVVNTGLDGETQPVKDLYCDWNTLLDEQASAVRYRFGQFMYDAMEAYREAFPNKTIYINNAPGGSGTRKTTSDQAASFDPPIGLKHSGMWVDLDSHEGRGTFYGSWDMIKAYSQTLPIWLESPFGLGGKEQRYWALIAGLHYHPDAIDLHPEFFTQSDPAWLSFAVDHLGVSLYDTPSVWTVLRDSEYEEVSWGSGGVSGHTGDWTFWLSRRDDAPESATLRVWREDMPAAEDSVYSRQTRRTQQSSGNTYMSFDIDDGYPYVAHKPIAEVGGNVFYEVNVTILNHGTDTFALEYRNWDGTLVSEAVRKGAGLGTIDDWVQVSFAVRDAYFDNNMPGSCDFRISCEGDGDEYVHMVQVIGDWTVPPTATAAPSPTPTATSPPTATATRTATPLPTLAPGTARFTPSADTFLDQWDPTVPKSTANALVVRNGGIRAPLLRFELSAIPLRAKVSNATLALRVMSRTNASYLSATLHKVLRAWKPATCTWYQASSGQSWSVAGCSDPSTDLSSVVLDQVTFTSANAWYTFDVTALVQEWVDDPQQNKGMILKGLAGSSVEYKLYSLEGGVADYVPYLQVSFDAPDTPTPTQTPRASNTPLPTATPTVTLTPVDTAVPTATWTPTAVLSPTPTLSATPTLTPTTERHQHEFRPDASGTVADAYIDAWDPETNYGDSVRLKARQGGYRTPLLRFDVSAIAADASVKQAELRLYPVSRSDTNSLQLSIVRLNRSWDEDWVSWTRATGTESWHQDGALDVEADRSSTYYATTLVDSLDDWVSWDITSLVQDWVSDASDNHGLLIAAVAGDAVQYEFASAEHATEEYRPYLWVEYELRSPSPTPQATDTSTPTVTPVSTPTMTPTPFPLAGRFTFQQGTQGYDGCEDTYVDEWNPSLNYGAAEELVLRQGDVRSVLIRYSLDVLPQNSVINDAMLHVYVLLRSGDHELPVSLYRVERAWDDDEATYLRASREEPWEVAGINGYGTDLAETSSADAELSATGEWVTFDVKDLVQGWVQAPDENHGIVIKTQGETAVQYELVGADSAASPMLRPRLFVDWASSGVTPSPTATDVVSTATATTAPVTATPSVTSTLAPTATPTQNILVLREGLDGYAGTSDTFLDGPNPDIATGQQEQLALRGESQSVGLIRFDLEDVPAKVRVVDARLDLWPIASSEPVTLTVSAYRLNRPWDEASATWLEAAAGLPWGAPGASAKGIDMIPSRVGQAVLVDGEAVTEMDITSAVKNWVSHPSDNHGLLLVAEGDAGAVLQYASSDSGNEGQRPTLYITYETRTTGALLDMVRESREAKLALTGIAAVILALVLVFGQKRPPGRARR